MPHLIRSNLFFFLLNIGLLLEKRKKAKSFHFLLSLLCRSGYWRKLENVVKNFLTVISNSPGFRLFTLNQVIDKVNCFENNLVLLSLVYFVKVIHQREIIEISAESVQC